MAKSNLKPLQNHIKKVLESRAAKRRPEQIHKQLTALPKRQWQCGKGKQALRYELYSVMTGEAIDQVCALSGRSPLLQFDQGGETRLEVMHGPDVMKVESSGAGLFGNGFTYIRHDTAGLLYLDRKDKRYLQLDPDAIPDGPLEGEVEARIDNVCEDKHEGKRVNLVDVSIEHLRQAYLRLWLWDDEETTPFRKSVFGLVLGCADKLNACKFPVDELVKLGVPLKGEVRLKRDGEPVSHFFLQDLRLESYNASDFDIPAGYRDLRDKEKAPEEGFNYEQTSRFSELRRGRTRPKPALDGDKGGLSATGGQDQALYTDVAGNVVLLKHVPAHKPHLVCQCLPSTYGSQIATEVQQLLVDDLWFLVNQVTRRLNGFHGASGNLKIDWLSQFKAHSDSLPRGDGLYCFLRDEPDPSAADPADQMGGQGLMDQFIERTVRKLLVDLTATGVTAVVTPPGFFSLAGQVTVPPVLATEVLTILGDASIAPEGRFDSLSAEQQRDLREAYLDQNFANISLTYPSSTGAQSIFHDLLRVRLDNIKFDIAINNTQIIDTFVLDDNDIHLIIRLPDASGRAFMSRWPSSLYWAVSGLGVVGCIFAPALCALLPYIAAVGAFLLLDFAFVSIYLSDLEIDAHISFTPNGAGVLQPNTTFALDSDVSVFYASVVPTGIQQILGAIYSIIGSHTDIVLSTIETHLSDKFNDFVRNDLGLSYPPKFGPVPLSGLGSHATGEDNDHLYLESELNAGLLSIINPYITQVDTDAKSRLLDLRAIFQSDVGDGLHHYGGFVFSQNFINHYIHILWRLGIYTYILSAAEATPILEKLKEACPTCKLEDEVRMWLCPVVSPRLVFTPCGYEAGKSYLTCFFDDLRLCIGTGDPKLDNCMLELQFSARVNAEIGFGTVNSDSGELDIIKVGDRFMDVYFNLDDAGIEIIHPDTQGHAATGDCYRDLGCKQLSELQECFRMVIRAALQSRHSGVVPRKNGEPITVQTYTFAGQFLRFQFWVYRGNLYAHMGFGGPALMLLEGGLFGIDAMDCATGEALRAFV